MGLRALRRRELRAPSAAAHSLRSELRPAVKRGIVVRPFSGDTRMPKSCPNCGASNKDEALFCKACGSSLADVHAASTVDPTVGSVTCSDCGHVNRPHTRYCARCGVNLEGTVILPRSRVPAPPPAAVDPYAAQDPLQAYERTQTYPPVPPPAYPPAPDYTAAYPPAPAYAPPPAHAPAAAYGTDPAYAPTQLGEDTLPPHQADWEPEPPA